jgi:hypothetical protein
MKSVNSKFFIFLLFSFSLFLISCNKDNSFTPDLVKISIDDLLEIAVDESESDCFGSLVGELNSSQGVISNDQQIEKKIISFQLSETEFIHLVDCADSIVSSFGNAVVQGKIFQTNNQFSNSETSKTYSILPNSAIKACLPESLNPDSDLCLMGDWQIQSVTTNETLYPPCEGNSLIAFEEIVESDSVLVGRIVSLNGFSIKALIDNDLISFKNNMTISLGIGSTRQSEFENAFFSILNKGLQINFSISKDKLVLSSENGSIALIKNQ